MKLLSYRLANISNLPNINRVVPSISFLYCKRFNTGRFPIVKFNHHFCFSKVKTIYNFSIYQPFFITFLFFWYESMPSNCSYTRLSNCFFLASYLGSSLLSRNVLDWNVWIISSLISAGEKKFLNVSSLKIVVNFLM